MSFGPGDSLGPYRITGSLGAGGMGEVYRARDPRLSRDVAIKVLHADVGNDVDRIRRFETEARAIAALNHPNICSIFDVGEQDGVRFLVMEFVAGETLASLIERGRVPILRAVEIAAAIAAALAGAHREGVVHRDLKPANVMICGSSVKLLDFGLAKLRPTPSGEDSMTQTAKHLTTGNAVAGTVPYMAPEQVEGSVVDARTDIWALGCVLHEMLTGERPFNGKTNAGLFGTILKDAPPPIRSLAPEVPSTLERLCRTCLHKNPEHRWQSAADLERQLRNFSVDVESVVAAPATRQPQMPRTLLTAGGIVAVAVVAVLLGGYVRGNGTAPLAVIHAQIPIHPADSIGWPLGAEGRVSSGRPSRTAIALSPDGATLVFVGVKGDTTQLYRRRFDGNTAEPIAGTVGADAPFFSPDSSRLGFWSAGELRWISIDGGPVQTIAKIGRPFGASWADDGAILLGGQDGVVELTTAGDLRMLTKIDRQTGERHAHPRRIPGRKHVIFTLMSSDQRNMQLMALREGTPTPTLLLENASDGRVIGGYLLGIRWGALVAARLDVTTLHVSNPVTVLEGVMFAINNTNSIINTGAGQLSISEVGHLAYLEGGPYPLVRNQPVWLNRAGKLIERFPLDGSRTFMSPHLSRDQRVSTFSLQVPGGPLIYDFRRKATTQLRFEGRVEWPLWSPDDQYVAFLGYERGHRPALYRARVDGGAPAERISDYRTDPNPGAWSADGSELLFSEIGDIFRLRLHDRSIEPVIASAANEWYPALSPDGRWLAYASNDSGQIEVYVSPYPSLATRRQVSNNRGFAPNWTRGGKELLYVEPVGPRGTEAEVIRMMAVDMANAGSAALPLPRRLFEKSRTDFGISLGSPGFAVTPDGERFLSFALDPTRHAPPSTINVIFNWLGALQSQMRTAGQ